MMFTEVLSVIAVIILIVRILNILSKPLKPKVWCLDEQFLSCIHKISPVLNEPYVPTRLWGFCGHVQTILARLLGRIKGPRPVGERVFLDLQDGTTLTYDLFPSLSENYVGEDITLAICPGIANCSQSMYVRTFVHSAQRRGYRCAALNHIGVLPDVPVTSSRIFTYGHTNDFADMVEHLHTQYVGSHIILVGFSLGGNLITKYMGEKQRQKPPTIIGGISICQGYDAFEGSKKLLDWQNLRRIYLYAMTESIKKIVLRHRHVLLSDEVKTRYNVNEYAVRDAVTLHDLDEAYTRRVHKFDSTEELYKWCSSLHYIENIERPMIFINAKDDPLVPDELLAPMRVLAMSRAATAFIEVAHGGHMGFHEGGFLRPNPVTWLDRTLVAMVGAIIMRHQAVAAEQNL